MQARRLGALLLVGILIGCDTSDLSTMEVGDLVLSVGPSSSPIRLQTEEEYDGCMNYLLAVDIDAETGRVLIQVGGLEEPRSCQRGSGPARVAVPAPASPEPYYEIAIEKDGRTDRFIYGCGFVGCELYPVGEPEFTRIGSWRGGGRR